LGYGREVHFASTSYYVAGVALTVEQSET